MRIKLTNVFIDDQDSALAFYTGVLGFIKKQDFPVGKYRWITVVSPEEQEGAELLLEPSDNPAAMDFRIALYEQGIPAVSFAVDDIHKEYNRLKQLGAVFTDEPVDVGSAIVAILDDTCGNLIQIYQV
jgi:predicted enzyme related to lactoylglutathione lyase